MSETYVTPEEDDEEPEVAPTEPQQVQPEQPAAPEVAPDPAPVLSGEQQKERGVQYDAATAEVVAQAEATKTTGEDAWDIDANYVKQSTYGTLTAAQADKVKSNMALPDPKEKEAEDEFWYVQLNSNYLGDTSFGRNMIRSTQEHDVGMATRVHGTKALEGGLMFNEATFGPADPNYIVPLDKIKDIDPQYQGLLMGARNEKHFEFLLRTTVKPQMKVDKAWSEMNYIEYFGYGAVSNGIEAVITGAGVAWTAGALAPAAVVRYGNKVRKIVNTSRLARKAGLKLKYGHGQILNAALAGAAANVGEAAYVGSTGIITPLQISMYPMTGAGAGAGFKTLSLYSQGKLTAPDFTGLKPRVKYTGPDAEIRIAEDIEVNAAHKLRAAKAQGIDVKNAPEPELGPMPTTARKTVDEFAEDVADEAPNSRIPGQRDVVFREDVKLRVREPGKHAEAIRKIDDDVVPLGAAFRSVETKTLHLTPRKMAKELGEAFSRQGYGLEKARNVFVVIGKNTDDFAKKTGKGLRVGHSSHASAKLEAGPNDKIMAVRLDPGTRVIDGGDLADDIGKPGQTMFGEGTINEFLDKSGKARAVSADGQLVTQMRFTPETRVKGPKGILSGKAPDDIPLTREQILAQNEAADNAAPDTWTSLYEPDSSAGAMRFTNESEMSFPMEELTKDYVLRGAELAPEATWSIGSWLSRLANMGASESAVVRHWRARLIGDALSQDPKNFKHNMGTSWGGYKMAWDEGDAAKLIDEYEEIRYEFVKEMKEAGRGGEVPYFERAQRRFFQDMHHEFINAIYDGVPIPKEYDLKVFHKYVGQSDAFHKQYKKWLQDPGSRTGRDGELLGVAGSEGLPDARGHYTQVMDMETVKKYRTGDKDGNFRNPNVVRDVYYEAIYNDLKQQLGVTKLPDDLKTAAKTLAEEYQASRLQRGSVGVDLLNVTMLRTGNTRAIMKNIRGTVDHGLDEAGLKRIEDALYVLNGDRSGASKNLARKIRVKMTAPVKIKMYDKNGKQTGFAEIRPMDLMSRNHFDNQRRYIETHNGWIAGANTVVTDLDGKVQTVTLPKDPTNPKSEMVTYPKTIRSQADADMLKQMARDEMDQRQIVEKTFGQESKPGDRSKAGLEDQTSLATFERTIDWLTNRSGENPHQVAMIARTMSNMYNMGNGWNSSLLEYGSIYGWTRSHMIARLAQRFLPEITGWGNQLMKDIKAGKVDEADLIDFRRRLQSIGIGVKTKLQRGQFAQETGSSQFAFGSPDSEALGDVIKYELGRGSNLVNKWGGSTPVQDFGQLLGAEAYADRLHFAYKRAKNWDGLSERDQRIILSAGFTKEQGDAIIKMVADDTVFATEGAYLEMITKVNTKSPGFNPKAYNDFEMLVRHMATNRIVMDQKYGGQVAGSSKGTIGPIIHSLQTFIVGSLEQQLKPLAKELAYDLQQGAIKAANWEWNAKTGALNHAIGVLNNGGMVAASGIGGWAMWYVGTKLKNWDKDAEWHEQFDKHAAEPDVIFQQFMDKSGILSSIPFAYNNTYSFLTGTPDWQGFNNDTSNPLFEMLGEGPVMAPKRNLEKAYNQAIDGFANGFTGRHIRDIGKLPGNFWPIQQGVNAFAEILEQTDIMPAGKEWNPAEMKTPYEVHTDPPPKKPDILDYDKLKKLKRKKNIKKIRKKWGID